jgi:hypothetical protein
VGIRARVRDSNQPQRLEHDNEAMGAFEAAPPLVQIMGALEALSAEVRELREARRGSRLGYDGGIVPPPEYSSERGGEGGE